MSETTYHQHWPESGPPIQHLQAKLRTSSGECLRVLGVIEVQVTYIPRANQAYEIVVGFRNWPYTDWERLAVTDQTELAQHIHTDQANVTGYSLRNAL